MRITTNKNINRKVSGTYESNRFITIPANKCMSDGYQRKLNENHVRNIMENFDENKVNPIKLSYRNGLYYVIDGQHTLTALRRLFGETVMVNAVVCEGLTYEQEAEYFTKQYEGSNKLNARDTFKSRLEYDNKAQSIKDVCTNAGFEVSLDTHRTQGKNLIVAVKQLERMYDELGRGDTYEVLTLIRDTWGNDKHSTEANMLAGMTMFYKTYKGKINRKCFVDKLGKLTPKEIMRNSNARIMSCRQAKYAYEIYYNYNKGIKRNRLPDVIR